MKEIHEGCCIVGKDGVPLPGYHRGGPASMDEDLSGCLLLVAMALAILSVVFMIVSIW